MEIIPLDIKDVLLIKPRIFEDERGYFFETFNNQKFEEQTGFTPDFVQDNESKSSYGVLRGLHFQRPPFCQAKLVRVVQGKVLDVAVDIRKNSSTYGHHVSAILSEENKHQMYVPRGFAHGFVVLSQEAIFSYKCDNLYSKEHEDGLMFNDTTLNIYWKIEQSNLIISEKDKKNSLFKDLLPIEL